MEGGRDIDMEREMLEREKGKREKGRERQIHRYIERICMFGA